MNKKLVLILFVVAVIVLIAGAAVGGFFGGMAYQKNQANTVRDSFMRERGIQGFDPNAAPNTNMSAGNFAGGGMGRGASGEVTSMDGNMIVLNSGDDESTITLTDTTTIVKYETGSASDIVMGQQVMVVGERDEEGNVTATQITILNTGSLPGAGGSMP